MSILLPAYNEASRLPRTFELLMQAIHRGDFALVRLSEIWVIDDGSTDSTSHTVLQAQTKLPLLKLHRIEVNAGKGNAVHNGLRLAAGDWCLIADADSATPWQEFQKLFLKCKPSLQLEKCIAIGSRDLPESDIQNEQSMVREKMGKVFNLLVRVVTGLPFKDTQCGFKLVRRETVIPLLPRLQVKRFAWDVELLMLAHFNKVPVVEVPVRWAHQEASRVNPVTDSLEMLYRVIQMRIRALFSKQKR